MRLCVLCDIGFDMNLGKISAKHHRGAKSIRMSLRATVFKSGKLMERLTGSKCNCVSVFGLVAHYGIMFSVVGQFQYQFEGDPRKARQNFEAERSGV